MTPCRPGGVTSAWRRDEDPPGAPRDRSARRARRLGDGDRGDSRRPGTDEATGVRQLSHLPRIRPEAGAAPRRAMGLRRRGRRDRRQDASRGRARRRRGRAGRARGRVLRDERPGGGGRRARPREDGRPEIVRRLGRSSQCGGRPFAPAEAARHVAPRDGLGSRAPAPRQPPARPVAGNADAGADRRAGRHPGSVAVPLANHDHRGRRERARTPPRGADARARRRLPHGAARGTRSANRPLFPDGHRPSVRPARRPRRRRHGPCDGAEPRGRAVIPRRKLAPRLHAAQRGRRGCARRSARPVPAGASAPAVRGPRPGDRADGRRRARARPDRLGRDRLRRTGRVRQPVEPLRRDRALRPGVGRGSSRGRRPPRSTGSTSRARPRRTTRRAGPSRECS